MTEADDDHPRSQQVQRPTGEIKQLDRFRVAMEGPAPASADIAAPAGAAKPVDDAGRRRQILQTAVMPIRTDAGPGKRLAMLVAELLSHRSPPPGSDRIRRPSHPVLVADATGFDFARAVICSKKLGRARSAIR